MEPDGEDEGTSGRRRCPILRVTTSTCLTGRDPVAGFKGQKPPETFFFFFFFFSTEFTFFFFFFFLLIFFKTLGTYDAF